MRKSYPIPTITKNTGGAMLNQTKWAQEKEYYEA